MTSAAVQTWMDIIIKREERMRLMVEAINNISTKNDLYRAQLDVYMYELMKIKLDSKHVITVNEHPYRHPSVPSPSYVQNVILSNS